MEIEKTLFLFDMDGTLAESAQEMTEEMVNILQELINVPGIDLAIVGGGDYQKITSQIGYDIENMEKNTNNREKLFKYIFSENGLVSYKNNNLFHKKTLLDVYTEDQLLEINQYLVDSVKDLNLPFPVYGDYTIIRKAMFYLSPVGCDGSLQQRNEFAKYEQQNQIRKKIIDNTKDYLMEKYGLDIKLGGLISLGIYPKEWNKSYVLPFISHYEKIYFFGDKCDPDGNDYPLYSHKDILGYSVKNPNETLKILKNLATFYCFKIIK